MNSRPMILRFASGSVTPASAPRNVSAASTTTRSIPVAATKSCSTCSASPSRSSPWSTNTQVSWSPTARWTRAAATDESTPPESPQITRLVPTCVRMRSTCSAITLPGVHVGAIPAPSRRKCSRASWPSTEWRTSGCHCMPKRRRSASSNAATGEPGEVASTVKPSGARCTESPWLIHTAWVAGEPRRRVPSWPTVTVVEPYSRMPVRPTSPPSARAIDWKP